MAKKHSRKKTDYGSKTLKILITGLAVFALATGIITLFLILKILKTTIWTQNPTRTLS